MALPSQNDLGSFGYSFRGVPFVRKHISMDPNSLGSSFRGAPFVSNYALTTLTVVVGQAVEDNVGQVPTVLKLLVLGQAVEGDGGITIIRMVPIIVSLGLASEQDVAPSPAAVKSAAVQQAVEEGLAQATTILRTLLLGQAVEDDGSTALVYVAGNKTILVSLRGSFQPIRLTGRPFDWHGTGTTTLIELTGD